MKKLITLLLVLVMALSLGACTAKEAEAPEVEVTMTDDAGAEEAPVEEAMLEGPIKIGVLSPTSGPGSVHGTPVKQAAELAAKEINEAGGIKGAMIEIIAYDTKGDATEAVNAYNKLRDQDEVVAIVGGTYSGATLGFKDLAVADGMPVLSPTATNPDVTLDAANVFRACYTDAYQGSVAATFALQNLKSQVPGVLYNKDDAYSEGLADNFIAACEAAGLTAVVEAYAAEDKDFSSQLSNLDAAGVDVLFVPHYPDTVGPILTQAKKMELGFTCMGGDGWDGIQENYAVEAEGFYFANHYSQDDPSDIVQNFITNYTAEYDETPNALGALAYDAVYLMADAIEAAGSTDSEAIVAALASTTLSGVTGDISFDANGDPIKSVAMIKVVDGALTLDSKVAAK